MDRRDFLRVTSAGSAALALPAGVTNALANTTGNPWRVYEVTTRVEVLKPAGETRVWIPLPLTADTDYQKSLGNTWEASNGQARFWQDAKYGAGAVAACTWSSMTTGGRPGALASRWRSLRGSSTISPAHASTAGAPATSTKRRPATM